MYKIYLLCVIIFLWAGCSQNDAQRSFRDQALQEPSGITKLDANGSPNGERDNDDWRIGPDFSGLVSIVTPAFPNPVAFNSTFEIDLNIKTLDAVNGLEVFAFQLPSDIPNLNPIISKQQTIQPGIQPIRISPQQFARSSGTGNIGNTYRIIFFDRQRRVITYGDVLVQ